MGFFQGFFVHNDATLFREVHLGILDRAEVAQRRIHFVDREFSERSMEHIEKVDFEAHLKSTKMSGFQKLLERILHSLQLHLLPSEGTALGIYP